MGERKALIVEDNLNWYRFFKETIATTEMNVFDFIHAPDLKTAKEVVQNNDVEVIILDLMLPDSSGVNTVAEMVKTAKYVPIIVLTTTDRAILGDIAMQYGIEDYLVKDEYDEKIFFHVVQQAILRIARKMKGDINELEDSLGKIREMQEKIDERMKKALDRQDAMIETLKAVEAAEAGLG